MAWSPITGEVIVGRLRPKHTQLRHASRHEPAGAGVLADTPIRLPHLLNHAFAHEPSAENTAAAAPATGAAVI